MTDRYRSTLHGIDRSRLDAVVDPVVRAHGGEVSDIEWKSEQGGWVLRILVEKLGSAEHRWTTQEAAVDLDLCSNIARELSTALDVLELIPHAYHLEVGSPGLERSLRGPDDFRRFEGQKAKLKLGQGVAAEGKAGKSAQKAIEGHLGPVEEEHVTVRDGSQSYRVPLSDIVSARLVFEFGPAPKPGKSAKRSASEPAAPSPKKSV